MLWWGKVSHSWEGPVLPFCFPLGFFFSFLGFGFCSELHHSYSYSHSVTCVFLITHSEVTVTLCVVLSWPYYICGSWSKSPTCVPYIWWTDRCQIITKCHNKSILLLSGFTWPGSQSHEAGYEFAKLIQHVRIKDFSFTYLVKNLLGESKTLSPLTSGFFPHWIIVSK